MATTALDDREASLWRAFTRSADLVTEAVDRALVEQHGIGLTDYELLAAIAASEARRVRMSELAEHLVVSRSNLSHRVTRLEGRGLVRRDTSGVAGRGVEAALTRSGAALARRAATTHGEAVRSVLHGSLNRKDRTDLGRLLTTLLGRLEG